MKNTKLINFSLTCLLMLFSSYALAMEVVIDPKNIVQTMKVVDEARNQVKNQIQELKLLNPTTYSGAEKNLDYQLNQLNRLLSSFDSINYQLETIEREYNKLFPSSTDWSGKSQYQQNEYYRKWSDELHEASRTAMQSQSVINNIKRNNEEAKNILNNSKYSDGEVRQIQATNQMLSLMTSQLADLTTAATTAGRVTASAAAISQSEQDAQREAMNHFTDVPRVSINSGASFNSF